ncbi:hypothetical protein MTO96_008113 [Rhipicephalus appendiculatus]
MKRAREQRVVEKASRETRRVLQLIEPLRVVPECSRNNANAAPVCGADREVPDTSLTIEHEEAALEAQSISEGGSSSDVDDSVRSTSSSSRICQSISRCQDIQRSISEVEVAPKEAFREGLRRWALENNIRRNALTDLLKLLKRQGGLHALDIPDDARTLLKTPRRDNTYATAALSPGEYSHFGLAAGLAHSLSFVKNIQGVRVVFLTVNVDGLPLSKSSKMQLWPIQCQASFCEDGRTAPFVVGAFAGPSKPHSSNDFLRPFVDELQLLISHGLTVSGQRIEVKLKAIVCDAPARSFIMMTKGHSGYSGCPKCTVEGAYIGGKVVFLDPNCPPSYRCQFQAAT